MARSRAAALPATQSGTCGASSGGVRIRCRAWKGGSPGACAQRCTICTELTCTFRAVCSCETHCRVRASQMRTRSAALQEAACEPSALSAQLSTGPECPVYGPAPSSGPQVGLKLRSSPLPQAQRTSAPLGPAAMQCTGAARVLAASGLPVPTSQSRTERSRLADATVRCSPLPGSRAIEVTASAWPAQLWKGLGACSQKMSARLKTCTLASAEAETRKVPSWETRSWVTSLKCAGQLLSKVPVLVCQTQMEPVAEPPKQSTASSEKVMAVIFSGNAAR
mmetsp:Transcript_24991/g.77728  ORF Transcript_24991/g.77728 Transcript_24991/m.77728 type:complete len:279 (+) Transcript_24991:375-1211(+)